SGINLIRLKMRSIVIITLVFVPVCDGLFGLGFKRTVSASGKLMCHEYPATNTTIYLEDIGIIFNSKIGETKTDSKGLFNLTASYRKILSLHPQLTFRHTCHNEKDGKSKCYKKRSIKIPSKFVGKDKKFDAGTIDLSKKVENEITVCP
ncbi:Transthyretin-like family protein, partial [Cooperia oncophora]